jgi:hypothetical protein
MTSTRTRLLGASLGSIICAAVVALATDLSTAQPAHGQGAVTTETLLGWVSEFSNWGRWDNELGAANFITDKKRMHAAKMVTKGSRSRSPIRC